VIWPRFVALALIAFPAWGTPATSEIVRLRVLGPADEALPSYLALSHELFGYAAPVLQEGGNYLTMRQASDYLTFSHLSLDLVARPPGR
jgi:hypothetical protein